MQTHEIRKRFLDHFIRAGHTEVPSASLILDDPNLLFVNAGMVPFKPFFLGDQTPPYTRATSVQKCVRTLDIEEVGITTRHNTFFQMAGNFSFGDYFKREAIRFAWELLTNSVEDGGYGIDPTRLWPTVYLDDDEAESIWRDEIGVPSERIQRRGMADNYWSMGVPGPCGPCSEIFYDRGPEYGVEGGPEADEDRYIEIWNLVFMQNERGEGTSKDDYEILGPLPKKNIDTGMGIERVACLLQGVDNVYETDLLKPIIDLASRLTGREYGAGKHEDDVRFRVVADHARTAAMLIGDGVVPANDGRGYVLRRLLRRIVRSMRLLGSGTTGAGEATMERIIAEVIDVMSPSYPELEQQRAHILSVAVAEETTFARTLAAGSKLFSEAADATKRAGSTSISGSDAFTLHDTYGFPIDLTLEMAAEAGLEVDREGFSELMGEQRRRAKADASARKSSHADQSVYREFLDRGPTEFTGFDELVSEARVLGLVADGQRVRSAAPGTELELILDRSPLYAESGGQMADRGTITTGDGVRLAVRDVQKVGKKVWLHRVVVDEGEIVEGDEVLAAVDAGWRHGATQGHSGTHMVHAALREVLGPTATQAGSLNRPGYLRFDFHAGSGLTDAQREEIERIANQAVEANYAVNTFETDLAKAKAMGAMALFGENYGDRVRVVEIGGPFSMELCGGTHVASSAQIGPITVIGESSVGSGTRRVEAYVGMDSFRYLSRERALMAGLAASLKVPSEEVPDRVEQLVLKLKEAEKTVAALRAEQSRAAVAGLIDEAVTVGDTLLVAARVADGVDANGLRGLVTDLRGRVADRNAVVALFSSADGKVPFAIGTTDAARAAGVKAGDLVKELAPLVSGRGGGKPDLAQGSGTDAAGIDAALARLREVVGGR
ncbi:MULTISPECIES: alanine--tRNA ligase [Gordonia]|uniref:Alanine--tRNA ligase n=1 Tax=Gordonia cholesterolivorans TaxID=559625 RepID=A0ABP5UID8_9ACTN|nr:MULTISPECIES: alanine--tRNA ligase [Gordonia]KJR06416.1 alanyl-tRNA synthetase [Gordonia sihwensis]KXT56904.1 alanyl-tRNA synthetase [Gordonia sp. QH-12]MBY4568677.1 alanine--tRNA ligase [Gordonia sihwensis]